MYLLALRCASYTLQQKTPVHKAIIAVIYREVAMLVLIFLIPVVNAKIIGVFWFLFKVSVILYCFIWYRGTFPRFRYDQLMRIGWWYMIPIGMGSLIVNGIVLLWTTRAGR